MSNGTRINNAQNFSGKPYATQEYVNTQTQKLEQHITNINTTKIGVQVSMPSASQEIVGQTFLYAGATIQKFTQGNIYQCQYDSETDSYFWKKLNESQYPIESCKNIRCITQGTTVRLKWEDPEDTVIAGETVAKWKKTTVVYKENDYPTSIDDGIVITSAVRNQYNSNHLTIIIPKADTTYYFQLFPETEGGFINFNESNRAVTGELTFASVYDLALEGQLENYFAPGDVISTPHSFWDTDGQGNYEMQIQNVTPHYMDVVAYRIKQSLQYDAPEKQYAFTKDTVFHPEYKLVYSQWTNIFYIEDKLQTGNNRVWWRNDGQFKIKWSEDNARWEIWQTNSATHMNTGTTPYAYQTTADEEPTGGVWSNASYSLSTANKYYIVGTDTYEEATVTAGETVTADTYYEKNPDNNRVNYGYNNASMSAVWQWLNSDKPASQWWKQQHIFDNAPGYSSTMAGFISGFTDPDFLKCVVERGDIITARNTVCDCGGYDTLKGKFYLLSKTEVFGSTTNNIPEGEITQFYTGKENTDRIKYNSLNQAQWWWLRSPVVGSAYGVCLVDTSGPLISSGSYISSGVAPACRLGVKNL